MALTFFNFFNSYTKYVIIYIFGLGINADMDQRIIGKTQPTLDQLNEDA
jgi:hypothetical protein